MDTLIFCDVSMDVLGRNSISPSLSLCVCIRCSSDWRDCEYRKRELMIRSVGSQMKGNVVECSLLSKTFHAVVKESEKAHRISIHHTRMTKRVYPERYYSRYLEPCQLDGPREKAKQQKLQGSLEGRQRILLCSFLSKPQAVVNTIPSVFDISPI